MPKDRLSVVVTRRLPPEVETRLSELFDVRLRDSDAAMDRTEIVEAMKTADVLVPTITDTVDAAMIGQAGDRLKLIANYGAGVDNIDVSTDATKDQTGWITVAEIKALGGFERHRLGVAQQPGQTLS